MAAPVTFNLDSLHPPFFGGEGWVISYCPPTPFPFSALLSVLEAVLCGPCLFSLLALLLPAGLSH